MKVGRSNEPLRPDALTTVGTQSRTTATKAKDATGAAAGVPTPGAATTVDQLGAKLGTADFNPAKVDEVRNAISEGRFKVDAKVVADRLVAASADATGKR
jgi:negative regulator of flagellin synthesis FlgM